MLRSVLKIELHSLHLNSWSRWGFLCSCRLLFAVKFLPQTLLWSSSTAGTDVSFELFCTFSTRGFSADRHLGVCLGDPPPTLNNLRSAGLESVPSFFWHCQHLPDICYKWNPVQFVLKISRVCRNKKFIPIWSFIKRMFSVTNVERIFHQLLNCINISTNSIYRSKICNNGSDIWNILAIMCTGSAIRTTITTTEEDFFTSL